MVTLKECYINSLDIQVNTCESMILTLWSAETCGIGDYVYSWVQSNVK